VWGAKDGGTRPLEKEQPPPYLRHAEELGRHIHGTQRPLLPRFGHTYSCARPEKEGHSCKSNPSRNYPGSST
jgi:hypothetical protein